MPVNALGWLGLARRAGDCWICPGRRDWLESLGLRTARDFLALPGIVVSGHVGRNVSRVDLGGTTAYLKREHLIRTRDRLRSWRDGFGWTSLSAREAAVLDRLERHDLPLPRPLALGEVDGQGFLLLEASGATLDIRGLVPLPPAVAERLGRIIARLHAAGVDQPDLFSKHVLACPRTLRFTILDWQRAVLRRQVNWRRRARGLAALRATFPRGSDPAWEVLMAAYLDECAGQGTPPPAGLPDHVAAIAAGLSRRRGIASQRLRTTAPVSQELVRIGGERVCAVPEVAGALQADSATAALYDQAADGRSLSLPDGRRGQLQVRRYRLPFARWWAALRGRSWRSPELRAARLLFHLERHGIPAPKLLAYGQTVPAMAPARAFLLVEPLVARPIGRGDAASARHLLDRLHDAGCRLTAIGPNGEPFGMTRRAIVRDVHRVQLVKRLTTGRARRDRNLLDAFFRGLR
jgi:hypothetical protein